MRNTLFRYILAPLLVLVAGGLLTAWFASRSRPRVYYYYESSTIPMSVSYMSECFTKITIWNSSRRLPARDVALTVVFSDARGRIRVGDIATAEPTESYSLRVTQLRDASADSDKVAKSGYPEAVGKQASVEAAIKRLAPASDFVVPVWWDAFSSDPKLEARGASDEGTLTERRREAPKRFDLALTAALVTAACSAVLTLWGWWWLWLKRPIEAWLRRRLVK